MCVTVYNVGLTVPITLLLTVSKEWMKKNVANQGFTVRWGCGWVGEWVDGGGGLPLSGQLSGSDRSNKWLLGDRLTRK